MAEASGARFTDVDGIEYVDFCLGDTGAMTGHSPPATAEAIAAQARRGVTLMLPTEDSDWVGEELARRFGLPYWQFALTATDANRFTIRLARAITGRPKILVYSWCYHGTVDETFAISIDGETRSRPDNIGPPVDPAVTTKAIEWNDVEALEAALAERRRRLRPRRAGDDQHRDHPPGARLPRRPPGADPRARHAAGDRRDPHDLAPAPAATPAPTASSRTSSRSASRSPPACPPPPTG